jgi:hypothetical protein
MISASVLYLLAVGKDWNHGKNTYRYDWRDKELDAWLNGPTWDTWYSEVLEDGTVIITSR